MNREELFVAPQVVHSQEVQSNPISLDIVVE